MIAERTTRDGYTCVELCKAAEARLAGFSPSNTCMFTASAERHRHVDSAAVCGQRAHLAGCSQSFASRLRAAKELLCLSMRFVSVAKGGRSLT